MQGPTTPSINSSFGSNDDDDSDDDESNDDSDDEEEEYKMVLVVRTDLQMTKGKIAAQCCHAAVAVVSELIRLKAKKVLDVWEESGSTKVALKAQNLEEILQIYNNAKSLNIPTDFIQDAGRTQIPEGSVTVVAVGPGTEAPVSIINKITGHLKLL